MIKQLIVVISLSVAFGNGYVILHPYISKVPPSPHYRIIQIAGPLQYQHVTGENATQEARPSEGDASNNNPDGIPSASSPQIRIMPGMVLPYGYAVTGVVPFRGYVPTDTHYINIPSMYIPSLHPPLVPVKDKNGKEEGKKDENGQKEMEESNGVKVDVVEPTDAGEETPMRRKRQDQTRPVIQLSFPELRIKAPPPEEHV